MLKGIKPAFWLANALEACERLAYFDDGVDDVGRAWPVVHAAWDHLWGMGTFAMPHSDGEWRV